MLNNNITVQECVADDKNHTHFIIFPIFAGKFVMVIGGERTYGTEKSRINDIEIVSFDSANGTVPECLQNFNDFPAPSITGWVVRI